MSASGCESALRSQDVHKVNVCVVAVGENFEAALLTTVIARKIGVPRVICRAQTEFHKDIFHYMSQPFHKDILLRHKYLLFHKDTYNNNCWSPHKDIIPRRLRVLPGYTQEHPMRAQRQYREPDPENARHLYKESDPVGALLMCTQVESDQFHELLLHK